MRKKIFLVTLLTLFLTSIAYAGPLKDFSPGKTAVEVGGLRSDVKISGSGVSEKFDEKYNMNWGVTTGLGGNFALQYKGFTAKGKGTYIPAANLDGTAKLNHHELNLLYKLFKTDNVFLYTFAGMARDKGSVKIAGTRFSSDSKNNWQAGVGGTVKIARKLDLFASVGAGNRVLNWKAGLSYALNKNFDIDVFYSYYKVKKLSGENFIGNKFDGSSKGIGLGLTFKF